MRRRFYEKNLMVTCKWQTILVKKLRCEVRRKTGSYLDGTIFGTIDAMAVNTRPFAIRTRSTETLLGVSS